jgi:S1-C subfamily serine protease
MGFRPPYPALIAGSILAAALLIPTMAEGADANAKDPPAAAPPSGDINNLVVKVFSTIRYPDPYRPWTKASPQDITGSGVVIEGKRILTNAHVVLYASQVQVQADQAGDKISATVEYVAPGIDLAVLKLDDESFFDSRPPLSRAKGLPQIKDAVMVYGFPTGGSSLSITKGIVSRIEFVQYHTNTSGLRIQIDAAINPGNSGGPAVVGDRMIGLAFSRLGGDAENIGYIIPDEEIELFLKGLGRGEVDNKPALLDEWQTLENPALRAYLGLPASVHGVIVRQPCDAVPNDPLRPWDVITRIGDTSIDDQGMIAAEQDLRLSFLYRVQQIARNWSVPLTIIRRGREMQVSVPLVPRRPALIGDLADEYPPYFIFGPVVFSAATEQFVGPIENNGHLINAIAYLGNPLVTRRGEEPAFPGEQLVVISSPFFPHTLAKGYLNHAGNVVKSVNGVPVRNLRHLVELLRDSRERYVRIDFYGRDVTTLVFERAEILASTEDILNDNGVRSQGSADTMAVWTAKPAAP